MNWERVIEKLRGFGSDANVNLQLMSRDHHTPEEVQRQKLQIAFCFTLASALEAGLDPRP